MNEQVGNFNREIKTIRCQIEMLELKIMVTHFLKNAPDGRLDTAGERISELEDRAMIN